MKENILLTKIALILSDCALISIVCKLIALVGDGNVLGIVFGALALLVVIGIKCWIYNMATKPKMVLNHTGRLEDLDFDFDKIEKEIEEKIKDLENKK